MKAFGTRGPVDPAKNYVVQLTDELAKFIKRVEEGRYMVIFAPRQTGKTTFFYHTHLTPSKLKGKPTFQFNLTLRRIKIAHLPIFTPISTKIFSRKLSPFSKNVEACLLKR